MIGQATAPILFQALSAWFKVEENPQYLGSIVFGMVFVTSVICILLWLIAGVSFT